MDSFYHITSTSGWSSIRKENGFRGGDGVCGFGVYLWDDLHLALEFVENLGEPDPVVLKVKTDEAISCEEALGGFPEREGDRAFYEHVFLVPLATKGSLWRPKGVRKMKIS